MTEELLNRISQRIPYGQIVTQTNRRELPIRNVVLDLQPGSRKEVKLPPGAKRDYHNIDHVTVDNIFDQYGHYTTGQLTQNGQINPILDKYNLETQVFNDVRDELPLNGHLGLVYCIADLLAVEGDHLEVDINRYPLMKWFQGYNPVAHDAKLNHLEQLAHQVPGYQFEAITPIANSYEIGNVQLGYRLYYYTINI